ncbi:MAG TPA: Na+/H+ antiporter [Solirubrobacteraceae bacterium]|nr:Na+/H+ antiporter [Solirubrobacteraceae bacterium]
MPEVQAFVAVLVAVVLLALLAERLRFPQPVALVIGGLAVGALPFAPDIELDPELIFLVFLPPILYPSAFAFAGEDLRSNLRPIAWLSIGLVLVTIIVVALVTHWVTGIPLAACFVLGAIVAPTDPVAATAVIRTGGAPERLATIVEGESLINDASALTALRIAIGAVGAGSFALGGSLLEFVGVAAGGAAVGTVLALGTVWVRRTMDDVELESAIAVLLAYGAFLLAEAIGVSGILATVLAGFVVGRYSSRIVSAETRVGALSFWGVARFLAESILFLLVGIAFGQVLDDPAPRGVTELVLLTLMVAVVTFGVRVLWMFSVPLLAGLWNRGPTRLASEFNARERLVLGVSGMRGATSVAAALTIPVTTGGEPFPERDTLIVLALGTIVALLVVPALALPALLRRLGLTGSSDQLQRGRVVRAQLAEAALNRAGELAARDEIPEPVLDRVRTRYEWRMRRAGLRDDEDSGTEELLKSYRQLRHELLAVERERLAELQRSGEVSGDTLRAIERDLDLEATRIR